MGFLNVAIECPCCYSRDVSTNLVDESNKIYREMSCENCYADWNVSYVQDEWEMISLPINPIPDPDLHVVRVRTTNHLITSQ